MTAFIAESGENRAAVPVFKTDAILAMTEGLHVESYAEKLRALVPADARLTAVNAAGLMQPLNAVLSDF